MHDKVKHAYANLFGSTLQLRSSSNNDFDGCQSWIGQHHLWQEVLVLLNSDMTCCKKKLGYDLQDKNQRIDICVHMGNRHARVLSKQAKMMSDPRQLIKVIKALRLYASSLHTGLTPGTTPRARSSRSCAPRHKLSDCCSPASSYPTAIHQARAHTFLSTNM
jgi:hypothetical protein